MNLSNKLQKSARRMLEASYDELDGLLINIGVMSALMLTLALPVLTSVPMEELIVADYRKKLIQGPEYRKYVIRELERSNFTFIQSCGEDELFDIKQALETPQPVGWKLNVDTLWSWGEFIELMDTVFHCTWEDVPKRVMANRGFLPEGSYGLSEALSFYCSLSVSMLSISLFGALFLYTALALSSAREQEDEKHTREVENVQMLLKSLSDEIKRLTDTLQQGSSGATSSQLLPALDSTMPGSETRTQGNLDRLNHETSSASVTSPEADTALANTYRLFKTFVLLMVHALYVLLIIGIIVLYMGFTEMARVRFPSLVYLQSTLFSIALCTTCPMFIAAVLLAAGALVVTQCRATRIAARASAQVSPGPK